MIFREIPYEGKGAAVQEGLGGGEQGVCAAAGVGDPPGTQWRLNGKKLLGVSRKTYYQWEERALRAMALALEDRPAGRPPVSVDQDKETLRERIRELEKKLDLAEKTIEVKELLRSYEGSQEEGSKKNRQIGKRR